MIHWDSRRSPDRGQMSHLRLREQELRKISPSPGSLLSIKLRSTLATNKRENSPRSLPLYNVKRPYVMELHKHKQCKHNSVERAVKLREKGIWGKDYGLGGACGGGCQICLPEARCSLAYFIRLNIVLIQC